MQLTILTTYSSSRDLPRVVKMMSTYHLITVISLLCMSYSIKGEHEVKVEKLLFRTTVPNFHEYTHSSRQLEHDHHAAVELRYS